MIELEPLPSVRPAVLGRKYVVASGHYLASMAGIAPSARSRAAPIPGASRTPWGGSAG